MKTLSPEHKAKLLAGRADREAAIRAKCESQTVVIDENWSIVRVDERNWQIHNKRAEKDGFENENFFGTLLAALKGLPSKMLTDEAKTSLASVMEIQKAIHLRIAQSLHAIEKHQESAILKLSKV